MRMRFKNIFFTEEIDRLSTYLEEVFDKAVDEYEIDAKRYYGELKLISVEKSKMQENSYIQQLKLKNKLERKIAEIKHDILLLQRERKRNRNISEIKKRTIKKYLKYLKQLIKNILKYIKKKIP